MVIVQGVVLIGSIVVVSVVGMEVSVFVQRCHMYFGLVSVCRIWLQQSTCIGKRLWGMQSGLLATLKEGELTDHASAMGIVEQLLSGSQMEKIYKAGARLHAGGTVEGLHC